MPSKFAKREPGMQLLLSLLILLPLVILFLLPGGGMLHGGMLFWMGMLLCFWLISVLFGTRAESTPVATARLLTAEEQPVAVKEVMDVRVAEEENGVRIFRGRLREPAAAVYAKLKRTLGAESAPMVQADEQFGASILLSAGVSREGFCGEACQALGELVVVRTHLSGRPPGRARIKASICSVSRGTKGRASRSSVCRPPCETAPRNPRCPGDSLPDNVGG